MCRAVLRSMYSSGLKPLTSPAILQSKIAVSKWVPLPIPETPSIMFDQTVSRSLPIGVRKPMPVTATRRPLELDVIRAAYGRKGQVASALSGKTNPDLWTSCPNPHQISRLEELSDLQRELQAKARGGDFEISTQELTELVEAVQDGMAVQPERGGRVLHRPSDQVGLQRLQELPSIAHLGIDQAAEAVSYKTLGEARVLGQDEVRDQLVMTVDHTVGAQLAAGLDGLLGLEI